MTIIAKYGRALLLSAAAVGMFVWTASAQVKPKITAPKDGSSLALDDSVAVNATAGNLELVYKVLRGEPVRGSESEADINKGTEGNFKNGWWLKTKGWSRDLENKWVKIVVHDKNPGGSWSDAVYIKLTGPRPVILSPKNWVSGNASASSYSIGRDQEVTASVTGDLSYCVATYGGGKGDCISGTGKAHFIGPINNNRFRYTFRIPAALEAQSEGKFVKLVMEYRGMTSDPVLLKIMAPTITKITGGDEIKEKKWIPKDGGVLVKGKPEDRTCDIYLPRDVAQNLLDNMRNPTYASVATDVAVQAAGHIPVVGNVIGWIYTSFKANKDVETIAFIKEYEALEKCVANSISEEDKDRCFICVSVVKTKRTYKKVSSVQLNAGAGTFYRRSGLKEWDLTDFFYNGAVTQKYKI